MSAGVPLGASITFQLASSRSARPASLNVGTLGSEDERTPAIAMALTDPDSMAGFTTEVPP